jgi:hypothetical protein
LNERFRFQNPNAEKTKGKTKEKQRGHSTFYVSNDMKAANNIDKKTAEQGTQHGRRVRRRLI